VVVRLGSTGEIILPLVDFLSDTKTTAGLCVAVESWYSSVTRQLGGARAERASAPAAARGGLTVAPVVTTGRRLPLPFLVTDMAIGEREVYSSVLNSMPYDELTAALEGAACDAAGLPADQQEAFLRGQVNDLTLLPICIFHFLRAAKDVVRYGPSFKHMGIDGAFCFAAPRNSNPPARSASVGGLDASAATARGRFAGIMVSLCQFICNTPAFARLDAFPDLLKFHAMIAKFFSQPKVRATASGRGARRCSRRRSRFRRAPLAYPASFAAPRALPAGPMRMVCTHAAG